MGSVQAFGISSALIVAVTGELDLATAPQLTATIRELPPSVRHVVVDLSATTFLDSRALGTLVAARRELAARDVRMHVVSPHGHLVTRVFEITRLVAELRVVDSVDEALGR